VKFEKIIIYPAKVDKKGKIIADEFAQPPYGYHHVFGVYQDGSSWTIATVDVSIDPLRVAEAVKHFAENMPPIEILDATQ